LFRKQRHGAISHLARLKPWPLAQSGQDAI
jgi:hypothetical protein